MNPGRRAARVSRRKAYPTRGDGASPDPHERIIIMRDDLVGYLVGALDAPDSHRVEAMLADPHAGASLRRDLELLHRSMSRLASDRDPFPGAGRAGNADAGDDR